MNLIKRIADSYGVKYCEESIKSAHTPGGEMKSQRVYCDILHKELRLRIVGEYELGAQINFIDDPIYRIILKIPYEINDVQFFPKSKISQFFQGIINQDCPKVLKKYNVKSNSLTNRLLDNNKFVNLILENEVYISSKRSEEGMSVILISDQFIEHLTTLDELLEIMTLLTEEVVVEGL